MIITIMILNVFTDYYYIHLSCIQYFDYIYVYILGYTILDLNAFNQKLDKVLCIYNFSFVSYCLMMPLPWVSRNM